MAEQVRDSCRFLVRPGKRRTIFNCLDSWEGSRKTSLQRRRGQGGGGDAEEDATDGEDGRSARARPAVAAINTDSTA